MIGLILLYFVGKAFYDLAALHERSRWGFAILGVASYYGGIFLGGILLAVLWELGIISLDGVSDTAAGFMALPVGVLTCWGTYALLKRQWERAPRNENAGEVLDEEFLRRD